MEYLPDLIMFVVVVLFCLIMKLIVFVCDWGERDAQRYRAKLGVGKAVWRAIGNVEQAAEAYSLDRCEAHMDASSAAAQELSDSVDDAEVYFDPKILRRVRGFEDELRSMMQSEPEQAQQRFGWMRQRCEYLRYGFVNFQAK